MSNKTPISPDVYSYMVDESGFSPVVESSPITAIAYIFSSFGVDNKLIEVTGTPKGLNSITNVFGKPQTLKYNDFAHAGMAEWCRGGASARVIRLTAPDAVKANAYIGIKPVATKPAGTAGADTAPFYKIGKPIKDGTVVYSPAYDTFYITTRSIFDSEETYHNQSGALQEIFTFEPTATYVADDLAVFEDLVTGEVLVKVYDGADWNPLASIFVTSSLYTVEVYTETDRSDKEAMEGFITIGKFVSTGSGDAYNGMYVRMNYDAIKSDAVGASIYTFATYRYVNGVVTSTGDNAGSYSFGSVADTNGRDMNIAEGTDTPFATIIYEPIELDAVQVTSLLTPVLGTLVDIDETDVNELFNRDLFSQIAGSNIVISGGSEGSINVPSVRTSLVLDFLAGNVDANLLDHNACPANFMFNLQTNDLITKACDSFSDTQRTDVFVIHTSIDYRNPQELLDWYAKDMAIANDMSATFAGWKLITDRYALKKIRVPMLYIKMAKWANHFATNGLGGHVLGDFNDIGLIGGYDPKSDINFGSGYKDKAYLAKLNVPTLSGNNLYYPSTRTNQRKASKLSMCHASYIQAQIGVDLEIVAKPSIGEYLTSKNKTNIYTAINNYMKENWINTPAILSFSVEVYASAYDEQNNQVRVAVEVEIANIIEKILITRTIK